MEAGSAHGTFVSMVTGKRSLCCRRMCFQQATADAKKKEQALEVRHSDARWVYSTSITTHVCTCQLFCMRDCFLVCAQLSYDDRGYEVLVLFASHAGGNSSAERERREAEGTRETCAMLRAVLALWTAYSIL